MEQMSLISQPMEAKVIQRKKRRSSVRKDWRIEVVAVQPQLPMTCEGFESLFRWSESEISRARCELLTDSIRELSDNRTNDETCNEIWDWVHCDAIHPFSFRVCVREFAAELGVNVDVETLREGIQWHARRMRHGVDEKEVTATGLLEIMMRT